MKAVRAEVREELDIVNVIEWRNSRRERWFLLVRRPEGGLLAGLHEFPTAENVSESAGRSKAAEKIPQVILSDLLETPPLPLASKDATSTAKDSVLRITKIEQAGDVPHVFSHIKKTYRAQWVLLQGGGDNPPSLVARDLVPTKSASSRGAGKQKASNQGNTSIGARWLPIDEVASAK